MNVFGLYAVALRPIDVDMAVRGYLTIVVTQASSRTKANDVVWDSTFAEGFVKGKKSDNAALQDDLWLIHASAV